MSTRWITVLGALMAVLIVLAVLLPASRAENVTWPQMLDRVRKEFPQVKQLPPSELAAWLADSSRSQPLLLDVREQAEFEVSHLAGAVRVAPDASAHELLAHLDPHRPIVVYCSVGWRSSRLATRLIAAGRTDVRNLEGSIFAWANEGRPLVAADGRPTSLAHPFAAVYGRLLQPAHHAP